MRNLLQKISILTILQTVSSTESSSVSSSVVNWKAWGGFLPAGNDVNTSSAGTTVAAAEEWCLANPECAGFTFNGPREGPVPVGETLYYKNISAVDEFVYNSTSTWTTYLVAQGPCDI